MNQKENLTKEQRQLVDEILERENPQTQTKVDEMVRKAKAEAEAEEA